MDISTQYCQEKAAKSGSSFYYSFLALPPEKRQAVIALYAFCREVDDIVDDCTDLNIAAQKLNWWAEEIEDIFEGKPKHPIGIALKKALIQFPLQKHLFLEILQGMQMDLRYQGYQTFDDLKYYCESVASAPGLLAAEIFGYTDLKTLEYAKHLGIALQLVNIIRDVGEDLNRGRLYIPEDELAQFSVTAQEIFAKTYSTRFKDLMAYQAKRARSYYQKALSLLPIADYKNQQSGVMMGEIYFALLTEIEKLGYQTLQQKVSLTPLRKMVIIWKTKRKLKKKTLYDDALTKA